MTVQEFSLEFDLLYDNIMSSSAPGIDEYEKSVYLTKAQLELIKEYNGLLNKYQKSFDGSEKRRVDFKELLKDFKTTTFLSDTLSLTTSSVFVDIPDEVFLIKTELGTITDPTCGELEIKIIPITLDEYNEKKDNPFRKPNNKKGWRVDFNSSDVTTSNKVEIITSLPLSSYQIRYIKYPEPIVLTDLTAGEFAGLGLTVDSITSPQTCLLNKEIHREVLDRAVELAILDYKANNLQNKVEINSRNN